ncbi:hypothetical protein RJ640_004924 [Escallonia rubra]|uniref:Uncharacterized protein n=1 Tax=Escallonia rubra TaxID=112253 RepID=A0AA88RKF0_9ASTE|nr:hypothetical protein RJ640_004924 [Escallonia rubra]
MAEFGLTAALFSADTVVTAFRREALHSTKNVQNVVSESNGNLKQMQAYLRDMEGKTLSELMKQDVIQVRDVAYDLEDVLDEFMLHQNHHIQKHGVIKPAYGFAHYVRHRFYIHDIKSKVQLIEKKIDGLRGKNLRTDTEGRSRTPLRTEHQVVHTLDDDEIVGFQTIREELLHQLTDDEPRRITISLVGQGGSGKTVLVRNVYENKRTRELFCCHALVRVSRDFQVENLFCDMLKQFCATTKESVPDEGADTQAKLRSFLQQKRYLVVLEDIWREEDWQSINAALPSGLFGSRIIVTTQNSAVASCCVDSPRFVHRLTSLPWPDAWNLFCKTAFKVEHGGCPPELEECSQRILKRCEGLPNAIVEVGSLLSNNSRVPREWEKFHNTLGSRKLIDRTLLPSYNDLSNDVKSCFLYFSIFPEDYNIKWGRLVRMWVAERFVTERHNETLEEIAEDYLDELIQRNLVHVSRAGFDGRVRSCRVPNLVLDFLVRKSEEENFVLVLADSNSSNNRKVRRLSVHKADFNSLPDLTSVRSIFLSFPSWGEHLHPKVLDLLHKFKLVRVLDLQGTPLDEFPKAIETLTLLRYLSLRNTNIKKVPKSIKKLFYLETLDLKQTGLTELPKQILKLHHLRNLLASRQMNNSDPAQAVEAVSGIDALKNLQKLSLVNYKPDLGELTQLRKLGLVQLRPEDGTSLCTSIQKMPSLRTLDISSIRKEERLFVEDLRNPPPHLQCLHLKGRLQRFPGWISTLRSLFKVVLKWSKLHYTISPLVALQNSLNLTELHLVDAYNGLELVFVAESFKKLKILYVEQLELLQTVTIAEGALPVLQKLTLSNLFHLKMLRTGANFATRVEEIHLRNMRVDLVNRLKKSNVDHGRVNHLPSICFKYGKHDHFSLQALS